jgi:hypothetical protein
MACQQTVNLPTLAVMVGSIPTLSTNFGASNESNPDAPDEED